MDATQQKNITEKAHEVTNISEKFQLIHATYACQSIIKEEVIRNFSIKYEDLRKRIEEKMRLKANYEAELEKKIFDENGNYNYEVIQKIRQLMAHELGHLILHTDELLHIDGTQGSKLITDEEKEEETDCFGKQLLHFRKERNEKIYRDGGAHKIY